MEQLPNFLPQLDSATEAALRASIERFGVLVPVVRDQHGRTLDGHHRSRIADELAVKYRVDVVRVADDDQAREIATTLNTDRRQLGPEQRREIVAALAAERRPDGVRIHSPNAIADALGVDRGTVLADEAELVSTHKLDRADKVLGKDGKVRPARRPTIVAAKNDREAEKAQQALNAATEPPEGVRTVRDITRRNHADARAQQTAIEQATPEPSTTDLDLRVGAVADLNIDEPVDCIITDPPYPREFLPVYTDLGWFASRSLRRGGSLVCMVGQSYLPEIVARLSEHLQYQWTLAYLTPGGQATQLWQRKVNTFWKPLLWFTNGDYDGPWIGDVTRSEVNDNDKRFHHWGQSESGMADIVRRFTQPGDLIVDPFLGGGTTARTALDLGRRFIGADIDPDALETTRRRFAA